MSKKYLFCVVSVVLLNTMPAYSVQYIDEFEYAKPATTSFVTEGVFQHNIVPIPPASHVGWDIDDWPTHDGNSINLYPAIDEVTFLLGPGEYVAYASVDLVNAGGSNSFEVIGTQGSYMVQDTPSLQWQTADTTGENLGQISMVRLLAYEGAFDNLTINVVPDLTADFDDNGTCDGVDLSIWQTNFGLADPWGRPVHEFGDADEDGDIDGNDFLIWQTENGIINSAATATIPEPTALLLAMFGMTSVRCWRRRR